MPGLKHHLDRAARRARLLAQVGKVYKIRRSGCFDYRFYRSAYPGLSPFWQRFPVLHYALVGERSGYRPNEWFEPSYYAHAYSDVSHYTRGPFVHFLQHGRREHRVTRPPETDRGAFEAMYPDVTNWSQKARYAVVAHVFYPDIWVEIADALAGLDLDFDLIITLPASGEFDRVAHDIEASSVPIAHIQRLPNIGRDILAFVHLVNSGFLSRYDAVCKLHTKKSPHLVDGNIWRRELLQGLLPPGRTRALVEAFVGDDSALVLVPDRYCFSGDQWWGINKPEADLLMQRIDKEIPARSLRFPAGSMYWCKPRFLEEIQRLALTPGCFMAETGQLDGTTAHAFERIVGYLAENGNGRVAVNSDFMSSACTLPAQARSEFAMQSRLGT